MKREKLTDVVGNDHYQVNNLLDDMYEARKPSVIVKEACAKVGHKLQYNLDTYNCEDLALDLRYGKAESHQFSGNPGDLIQINRGSSEHWAVYIGEQEVVHLVPEGGQSSGLSANLGSSSGKVKREKLTDVAAIPHCKVNNLLDEKYKARDPSIIVKEACEMVGRELKYGVVSYNSKHFATELRYGKFNGKPGDLIQISRGSSEHWAVYIGGQMVVHLVPEGGLSSGSSELLSISNGKVKCEKFNDVVGSDRYQVNNLLDKTFEARETYDIVIEACEMMGQVLQYNVDTYNNEHFATDLRYGKAVSRQFNGKPGDLIQISRGLYWHWAVYIGENEVVHLVTDGGLSFGLFESLSKNTGIVKCEKFADVVGIHRCQVNNLLDEEYKARDPSIIVKEACAMVGRKPQYNVLKNNSQHFATEMRYGVAESLQIITAAVITITKSVVAVAKRSVVAAVQKSLLRMPLLFHKPASTLFKGKQGDLIEIFEGSILYQHWAVYIGENEVVHFEPNKECLSYILLESLSTSTTGFHQSLIDVIGQEQVNKLLEDMNQTRECNIIGMIPGEHLYYDMLRDHLLELISKTGEVKRQKLADVVKVHCYRINNLLDEEHDPLNPDDIVKKAIAMMDQKPKYNIATYNCEHFATEMRYDKAVSRQVPVPFRKGASVSSSSK